ncbi:LacI family transcriptional regulator [bacterium]|nr:MAG: LacI family transcriptional regulator [bacterium]
MPRPKNGTLSSGHSKRVTMKDIADAAGVHVMTVSNALGNTRNVAPETREKIQRLAQELNYTPNISARALVAGKTGMIAVLCGGVNESYYANMVHILESHLDAEGYNITLLRRPYEVMDLVNATGSLAVDGAIGIDMFHLVDEFHSHPAVPCVSIGTYKHNFLDCVLLDLSTGFEKALNIILEQGRQRIAYVVTAPHLALPSEVRARTYLEFMERIGRPPEIIDIYVGDDAEFPLVEDRRNLEAYFREHGCPDALLCINDETAMCAYRVLRDFGRRVPDDVLLVGCDGQLHMEYFDPPLSTIAQPMKEMCAQAWRFLMERRANPDAPLQQVTFEGELIVRESLQPSK